MKRLLFAATLASVCLLAGCNKLENQDPYKVYRIYIHRESDKETVSTIEYEWNTDGSPKGQTRHLNSQLDYKDADHVYGTNTVTFNREFYGIDEEKKVVVIRTEKHEQTYTDDTWRLVTLRRVKEDGTETESEQNTFNEDGMVTEYIYKKGGVTQKRYYGYEYDDETITYDFTGVDFEGVRTSTSKFVKNSAYNVQLYTVITAKDAPETELSRTTFLYHSYYGYYMGYEVKEGDKVTERQTNYSNDNAIISYDLVWYGDDEKETARKTITRIFKGYTK